MNTAAGQHSAIVPEPDHVTAQFAAIMAGDMTAFVRTFAPGATIWHNYDNVSQDVETTSAVLAEFHRMSFRIEYREQRIVACGNTRFVQHILYADLRNGETLYLPAMMRVELAEDGRVARLEEYFDSRGTDCMQI